MQIKITTPRFLKITSYNHNQIDPQIYPPPGKQNSKNPNIKYSLSQTLEKKINFILFSELYELLGLSSSILSHSTANT